VKIKLKYTNLHPFDNAKKMCGADHGSKSESRSEFAMKPGYSKPIRDSDCDPDSDSDDSGVLSFHFHIYRSRPSGVISGRMWGAR
jgi:hypothetical protein